MKKNLKEEIEILRKELKKMEQDYYQGTPTKSDDLYDYKLRKLAILEQENPDLITEDSPTQKIGFYDNPNISYPHETPMLSLNNAFNKEDLISFFNHCEKKQKNLEYILEPKIDGASISLIYENNTLKTAISRGDGEKGEDLTQKLLQIEKIPIYLRKIPKKITIRGELYITKSDFESIRYKEQKIFSNHRNFVAGTLRLKNPKSLSDKKIKLITYQVLNPENFKLDKQSDVIKSLKEWGFETHENVLISNNKEEIYEYIKNFENIKINSDVPYDGLVIKVNELSNLKEIGFTSKFPKWAIAYKYPSQIKESKLLEIFPTVGRTGKITYTGRIEPIEIDGSIVQNSTLHNSNYIMDLDLRIGDYVNIYKSGEIVPKIIGYNKNKRPENSIKWEPITKCPSCNHELIIQDNLSTQFCLNEDCEEKNYAKLTHWTSRSAADIEGLSKKIIVKISKLGIIKTISDIYKLKNHKEVIINSDLKIKDKLFNKLVNCIEKSKEREFKNLLFGLGINFIGEEVANLITQKYTNIDELMNVNKEDLLNIEGVGEKGAQAVVDWFKNPKNISLIKELKNLGLFQKTKIQNQTKIKSFLTEKRVVITGKLSKSREEFSKYLNSYGAIVQKDINLKTDYLIVGENAGSKLKEAEEKKIKTLTEEELENKLKEIIYTN